MDPALVREKYEWSNNWWDCADDDSLPRVLLIGDSISVGYGGVVIEQLAGVAHVDRLSNSRNALDPILLRETEAALADRAYAAIHFNNGLHGWHLACEDYERGLRAYVDLLAERGPGAQLIWAASTPITVVDDPATLDEVKNVVVLRRNEVAAEIMAARGLPTNDLYALVVGHAEYKSGDGYHFTEAGKQVQGHAVAAALRPYLG